MSFDVNAVRQRHLRPEQMEHRTFYEGHVLIDLARALEEIERLQQGADQERAAVVSYLRRETYPCCSECNGQLADWIERGDHHRHPEKE